jgi:Tfp pilus assembly protein PilV
MMINVFFVYRFLKPLRSSQGSFLLEALLSVVILSTSIAVILQSLTSAVKNTVESSRYTAAAVLADNYFAERLLDRFISEGVQRTGHFETPHEEYQYALDSKALSVSVDGISQVDLIVSWPVRNKEKKIRVSTYLLNPPQTQ